MGHQVPTAPDGRDSSDPTAAPGARIVWAGEVTWRQVAELRTALFDEMDARDTSVTLDVRDVTVVDRTGIALLIGANHRSHAMRRPLVLLDADGPVSAALTATRVAADFTVARPDGDGVPDAAVAAQRPDLQPGGSGESAAARPLTAGRTTRSAAPEPLGPADWVTARRRYLDALWHGERDAATAVAWELLSRGASAEQIIGDLLAVAQSMVGSAWQEGRWSIAGEHLATAITESVMRDVCRAAAREPGHPAAGSCGQTAVVPSQGEWHTLSAHMGAEVLRLRGAHVTYVAPTLPDDDLVEFLLHDGPTVVTVTCSTPMNLAGAWRSINALRAGGMTVVCAGRGFGTGGRWGWALGADQWAPDLSTGADRILTAIDRPPMPPRGPLTDADVAWEMGVLRRQHERLLLDALDVVSTRHPEMVGTDSARSAASDRIEAVLMVVGSATVVSDPAVATEHATWLESTLRARSLPLLWAAACFDALLRVLPHDLTHARAMALTGRAACDRDAPTTSPDDWTPPTSRRRRSTDRAADATGS